MRLTIESTDKLTVLDGVRVRVWEGRTEDGTPCKVFVHRLAVREDQDCERFHRDLAEQIGPGRYVPLSMIL